MGTIKTFIFFDLETSGLPDFEYNKTKVTEISLVAAERDHIQDCKYGEIPRVLQKLTICVYPKRPIQQASTVLSGLTNELLENQKPFDNNTFDIIRLFLNQLPKPMCLVAHNGNKFDFGILQKEFNALSQSLSDEILCVDSLDAFREFHEENVMPNRANDLGVSWLAPPTNNQESLLKSINCNTSECTPECSDEILDLNLWKDIKAVNETTPKRRTYNEEINKFLMPNRSKFKRVLDTSQNTVAKKRLCFSPTNKKLSFKLVDIYKRIFNKEPEFSHRAENDAIILMHCAVAYGNGFMNWADQNAKSFNSIPPL